MLRFATSSNSSSSSDEDSCDWALVRVRHVPIQEFSASPMRFAANLYLATEEATVFAEDFLDHLSHAKDQPDDVNLNMVGSMRIETVHARKHGLSFGRHGEARFPNDAMLRLACRESTDWVQRCKLPHVLWWEESTGYPCVDFKAFKETWIDCVPVMKHLYLIRALLDPDADQAKDSFRHKANAWGFVFTRLSEGVYRMQLSRNDHPPCDFRRNQVGLDNVPFKRCESSCKVKLPTTKERKRKRC